MKTELLKTKILVLWVWMAVAMSAHGIVGMMDPSMLEMTEEMGMEMPSFPGMMFLGACFWIIPLVMAFLTLTLKDSADRLANMIMGGIFTAINFFHFASEAIVMPTAHHGLIVGSTVVATALIFVYALKWPKEEL